MPHRPEVVEAEEVDEEHEEVHDVDHIKFTVMPSLAPCVSSRRPTTTARCSVRCPLFWFVLLELSPKRNIQSC